jgi:hypothetical protein
VRPVGRDGCLGAVRPSSPSRSSEPRRRLTKRELDLTQVHTPLMDAAMFVRGVPAKVGARLGHQAPPGPPPRPLTLTGDGPGLEGWLALGESPEREIALGPSAGSGSPRSSGTTSPR